MQLLASYFARLESTSGRLAAVRTVAELFGRLAPAEFEPVVYLLQGQLRPAYEGVELGIGERLLVRALARAYGASDMAVTRRSHRLGDLGLVAESLAAGGPRQARSVRTCYEALLQVAAASGGGSIERKIELVAALLRPAGPLEARFLVRAVQGRLRLGIGDATIVEAVALGALGDRRAKPVVEHAYNVRSDLGGVVRLAYAKGEAALRRVGPRVGVPVRPALAQRLASAQAIIARLGTVQAEPKYDGLRLQLHRDGDRVWAFSRRLENVSDMFPDLTAALRRQLRARRAIIEGEAVVYDARAGRFLPFQVTMTRKRSHGVAAAAARYPLRLYAFDLLYADGASYLARPQRERHARLAALLRTRPGDAVVVTDVLETDRARDLERYFRRALRQGLEGLVAKRPDAPYRAGARGYDWVKLKRAYQSKLRDTMDVVIVGYLRGRGRRAALGVGSLLAAVYEPRGDRFRSVAKIGSGLGEGEWKALRRRLDGLATLERPRRVDALIVPDVWVEPRIVVEVLADEVTRSPRHTCGRTDTAPGYALRFPRLLGVRGDKAPENATTEREVIELHRLQRRVRR